MSTDLRILSIDYGEKRIGLALSDPMGVIASGFGTIENTPDMYNRLGDIVREQCVARIIVGLPLSLAGDHGDVTRRACAFAEKLGIVLGIPVEMLDERFTSTLATNTIRSLGVGRMKRRNKGKVDEIAAVILLQDYLRMRGSQSELSR